jgi:uncharacterized protein
MGRLLTLIALVLVAAWLVRRALRRAATPEASEAGAARDAQCGLLLPRAEARQAAGASYCSEEHARLGPAPRAPRGR